MALYWISPAALIVWDQHFHSTIFVKVVHSDYTRAHLYADSAHVIAFKHKWASEHKATVVRKINLHIITKAGRVTN